MLTVENNKFLLNGKPFVPYSGAIHYFRTLPEYWEDRLTKLKLCGFNTVETYVCWNLHEPKKGEFDFSGMLDIRRFLSTAQGLGLNVILRPGPYICAEWDFGGFPAWLLKDKNVRLRCDEPVYFGHVTDFITRLFEEVGDFLSANGGNIIAVQVENEYGSYGNDKTYLKKIRELLLSCGVRELLFTSDGANDAMLCAGTLEGVVETVNFGSRAKESLDNLAKHNRGKGPEMCAEFWCGWFDRFGEKHHTRKVDTVVEEIKEFLRRDAGFNVYMFHGGTNFGFMAGANYFTKYSPTVTSYDYDAFLTENGDYTAKYHAIRKLLLEKQGLKAEPLPPSPVVGSVGEVALSEVTSLWSNLDNLGEKHYSAAPETMEHYGQNFGMTLYETKIEGKYPTMALMLKNVHDFAKVYVNDKHVASFDRRKGGLMKRVTGRNGVFLPSISGTTKIKILTEAFGRVNYGVYMEDRKGLDEVLFGAIQPFGYKVTTLPLDNLEKLDFSAPDGDYPKFFRGKFRTAKQDDLFVRFDGFTRGYIFVNGFNLGRFWNIGPQKKLYLPGVLLKTDSDNEIVVLESVAFRGKHPSVRL